MLFHCAIYSNAWVSVRRTGNRMRHFFEILQNLNKKLIFLSVYITIIIISDLTINIRSTVLKRGVFRSVHIFYFTKIDMPKQAMDSQKLNTLPFLTVLLFVYLEHHPLDINL